MANSYYDPADLMTIWEDEVVIAGWLLVDVGHKSFDDQVRPELATREISVHPGRCLSTRIAASSIAAIRSLPDCARFRSSSKGSRKTTAFQRAVE